MVIKTDIHHKFDRSFYAALFFTSLALRLAYLAAYPLNGLYGQDAYAYHDFAVGLLNGQPPALYFPLGYPLMLTALYALVGASAAAGQSLSLIMGSLLAPLAYGLARALGCGCWSAFAAGLVLAVCGQAVQSSLVLMADIPALLWATLSGLALLRYLRLGLLGWLLLAALLLAFAGMTRWLALTLIAPWGLAVILSGRFRVRHVALAGLIGLLALLPQIGYTMQHRDIPQYPVWIGLWSPAHFFARDFVTNEGQFRYAQSNAVYYAQPLYNPYYLSPLLTPLALVGMVALARRNRAGAALLLGWLLLPLLVLMGTPQQNIRYPLIVFPAVAALVGVGLAQVGQTARETARTRWERERTNDETARTRLASSLRRIVCGRDEACLVRWLCFLLIIVVMAGVAHTISAGRDTLVPFLTRQMSDRAVLDWTRRQLPPGSTVYTLGLTLALKYNTDLTARELYYETPESLAARQDETVYLLLDVWNIEQQWAGRAPEIAYRWFQGQGELREIGRYGSFTLFEVNLR